MTSDSWLAMALADIKSARYAAVIRDRLPRVVEPLTSPQYSVYDPAFGSQILRVTNQGTAEGYPISYRTPAASVQRAWSADSSRFIVIDTYGRFHWFSVDEGGPVVTYGGVLTVSGDVSWHDRHPDWVYGRHGNRVVKRQNVRTGAVDTVVDLDTLGLNLPVDSYTGAIYVQNDTLMVSFGGQVNDFNHYVLTLNLSTGAQHVLDTNLPPIGKQIHGSVPDLTARFLVIQPSGFTGDQSLYVVDRSNGNAVTQVTVATSGHFSLGKGMMVNQTPAPNSTYDAAQWVLRDLANPNEVTNIITPVLTPAEVYLADHSTWTHSVDDESIPFLSATYRYQASEVPWRAWDDEIIRVNMGGEVRRLAHHRSSTYTAGGVDFWATPRPNISPNGRLAIFTSNWGRTLGQDTVDNNARQDVFLLEIR